MKFKIATELVFDIKEWYNFILKKRSPKSHFTHEYCGRFILKVTSDHFKPHCL